MKLVHHIDMSAIFTPEIRAAAITSMRHRVRKAGRGPGSLEPEETAGLNYRVSTGEQVAPKVVDAVRLAVDTLADIFGPLRLDDDPKAAVNVNTLSEGERYELHVDGNPITLLVFLNDDFRGGELVTTVDGVDVSIVPAAGWAVLLQGWCVPHRVTPVTRGLRHTMPVNLYPDGWTVYGYEGRAGGLNDYLHGS